MLVILRDRRDGSSSCTIALQGLEVSQNNDADQYTLLEQEKAGAEKKLEPIKERRVAVRDRAAFAQTRVAEFEVSISVRWMTAARYTRPHFTTLDLAGGDPGSHSFSRRGSNGSDSLAKKAKGNGKDGNYITRKR